MTLNLVPRGLLYFQTVADIGSIQGASRELGIAASAVNRQILMIEDQAGLRLFERSATGMTLTTAGQNFLVLAQRWRRDSDGLWSELKRMQGIEHGLVRIAAMDSQANGVLPGFVASMAGAMPGVQLHLDFMSPDNAMRSLRQGAVDIAMAFNARRNKSFHSIWAAELPLGCVMCPAHPLAGHPAVSLAQITQHPIALQSQALSIRRVLEDDHEWLFQQSSDPLTTNSLQLIKQVVRAGSHVFITSELDAATEIVAGELLFRTISDSSAQSQKLDIAIDSSRSISRIAISTAEHLADATGRLLDRVRCTLKAKH